MECEKAKLRDFFSLFHFYNCYNCMYMRRDETIVIGLRTINIYKVLNGCSLERAFDQLIYINKKIQKLLCEFSLNQKNNLFLWFDGYIDIDKYDCILSSFLNLGYNIHIINT